jgi:hypothetical protein
MAQGEKIFMNTFTKTSIINLTYIKDVIIHSKFISYVYI